MIKQKKFVQARDGVCLYTEAAGAAASHLNEPHEAIIFVHGLTGSVDIYDPIFDERLLNTSKPDRRRILIRYDRRGHGDSDKPPPGGPSDPHDASSADTRYNARTYADDFASIAASWGFNTSDLSQGGKKIYAVGWSIGCSHITELPRFHPALLTGALFVAPVPWPGLGREIAGPIARKYILTLRGAAHDIPLEQARWEWTQNFTANPDTLPQEVHQRWYEKAQLLAPAVAAHYGGRTDDDGGHSLISAIQQGNLALFHVHGDRDGHIDCEKAIHALSSRIDSKNYRAFRIPGAGHSVMYDAPQQLIDCILDLTNAHAQLSR